MAIILLIIIAVVVLAAVAATLIDVVRDGYHAVATRRDLVRLP